MSTPARIDTEGPAAFAGITDEWHGVFRVMEDAWGGDMPDHRRASYITLLGKYGPGAVFAALQRLSDGGQVHMPRTGEIAAEVLAAEGSDVPTWAEAFSALWGGAHGALSPLRSADEMAARAESVHPWLGSFVVACGAVRLRSENVDGDEWGGATRKRLGDEWAEHVRRCEVRERNGEVVNVESAKLRAGGLRKLASAVPVGGLRALPGGGS